MFPASKSLTELRSEWVTRFAHSVMRDFMVALPTSVPTWIDGSTVPLSAVNAPECRCKATAQGSVKKIPVPLQKQKYLQACTTEFGALGQYIVENVRECWEVCPFSLTSVFSLHHGSADSE